MIPESFAFSHRGVFLFFTLTFLFLLFSYYSILPITSIMEARFYGWIAYTSV